MPKPDADTVQRMKEEITALSSEQVKALEHATYLGLTPEGAKGLAERRAKILRLQEQLGRSWAHTIRQSAH
jgi:hypothetical protein